MPLAANIDPHLCIATSDISLQIISHNIQLGFLVYLEVTDKRQERAQMGTMEKRRIYLSLQTIPNDGRKYCKILDCIHHRYCRDCYWFDYFITFSCFVRGFVIRCFGIDNVS